MHSIPSHHLIFSPRINILECKLHTLFILHSIDASNIAMLSVLQSGIPLWLSLFLLLLPPPTSEGYVIIFVGLFVYFCLSVSNFVVKCLQGFSLLFRHGTRKNLEDFDDDTFNPLNTGFLFSILSRKSVSVSNITWNTWTDFYEIVRTGRETKNTIWNIPGVVPWTAWIQESFFYFLDSCSLAMLWKKRIKGYVCRDTETNQLHCFTPH